MNRSHVSLPYVSYAHHCRPAGVDVVHLVLAVRLPELRYPVEEVTRELCEIFLMCSSSSEGRRDSGYIEAVL